MHNCVKDAFEFVHGFGFSGWDKMCVGEPHPSVGLNTCVIINAKTNFPLESVGRLLAGAVGFVIGHVIKFVNVHAKAVLAHPNLVHAKTYIAILVWLYGSQAGRWLHGCGAVVPIAQVTLEWQFFKFVAIKGRPKFKVSVKFDFEAVAINVGVYFGSHDFWV